MKFGREKYKELFEFLRVKSAWNGVKQKRVVERIWENKGENRADFLEKCDFWKKGVLGALKKE